MAGGGDPCGELSDAAAIWRHAAEDCDALGADAIGGPEERIRFLVKDWGREKCLWNRLDRQHMRGLRGCETLNRPLRAQPAAPWTKAGPCRVRVFDLKGDLKSGSQNGNSALLIAGTALSLAVFLGSLWTASAAHGGTTFTGDKVQGVPVITQLSIGDLKTGKTHRFMFQAPRWGPASSGTYR